MQRHHSQPFGGSLSVAVAAAVSAGVVAAAAVAVAVLERRLIFLFFVP